MKYSSLLFIFSFFSLNLFSQVFPNNMTPILKKYGLTQMTLSEGLKIKDKVFISPTFPLEKALDIALKNFLESIDEGNETPLDIYQDYAFDKYMNLKPQMRSSISFDDFLHSSLKELVDTPQTFFSLITPQNENASDFNLKKTWVFQLAIPTLSDHSFWCVIPKNDPFSSYTYGTN